MTARRDASQPLSSSRLQERKGAADRAKANPDWFYPSPRQEPEKGPASAAGIHAHVVGAVAGSGAADESSDSEAEQEGPQKLIRKVSTSGQIRSKVRHIFDLLCMDVWIGSCIYLTCNLTCLLAGPSKSAVCCGVCCLKVQMMRYHWSTLVVFTALLHAGHDCRAVADW